MLESLPDAPFCDHRFPTEHCWFSVVKDIEKTNLKYKYSKEYVKILANKHKKALNQLNTGHYNMFNQPIITDSVANMTKELLFLQDKNVLFYRVKPTACKIKVEKTYLRKKTYEIYEFDVVKKFTPNDVDDILMQLHQDGDIDEVLREVFDIAYKYENYRSRADYIFKFTKNVIQHVVNISLFTETYYREYKLGKRQLHMAKFEGDDRDYIEKLLVRYVSKSYIYAHSVKDDQDIVITFDSLIRSRWFETAKIFLHYLTKDEILKLTKINKEKPDILPFYEVEKILYSYSKSNVHAREIVRILQINSPSLKLEIYDMEKVDATMMKPTSIKEFCTVEEVRLFLINSYDINVMDAAKDLKNLEIKNTNGKLKYIFCLKR